MTETPVLPPPSDAPAVINSRPGLPLSKVAQTLGPLEDLAGIWIGTGFNLISLPDFDSRPPSTGPRPFRLKLNSTVEILEFSPIGGAVPNRGSNGQQDIDIFGLRYLQRVADATTNEALHVEPGFWLNVPPTVVPPGPATVVRQGSIPHGTSVLALGEPLTVPGGPRINPADSTPTNNPDTGTPLGEVYLKPFAHPRLPRGFKRAYVKDLNLALTDAISKQTITQTVVLPVSTAAARGSATQIGGLVNIPFNIPNANATRLDSIFWIETVQQPDGDTFLQLQYTQTVVLNFLGIDWPHLSVATLVKQ
ncbi:conserved hypothetical protein [Frankia sp. AiPs1]|uniref:heme-binding protein n=1 Tax=Frankia sp. AiPa1 TaxID=573492 RepID=UPI00202B3AF8|nr:heme-binding protein [Frankia sp. AiPa1]MCL9761403.1 heme-binding protein [Frankia sp. AiPa1]